MLASWVRIPSPSNLKASVQPCASRRRARALQLFERSSAGHSAVLCTTYMVARSLQSGGLAIAWADERRPSRRRQLISSVAVGLRQHARLGAARAIDLGSDRSQNKCNRSGQEAPVR